MIRNGLLTLVAVLGLSIPAWAGELDRERAGASAKPAVQASGDVLGKTVNRSELDRESQAQACFSCGGWGWGSGYYTSGYGAGWGYSSYYPSWGYSSAYYAPSYGYSSAYYAPSYGYSSYYPSYGYSSYYPSWGYSSYYPSYGYSSYYPAWGSGYRSYYGWGW